jgi:thioesterase domain-containing protein
MAQELHAQGERVALLALFDAYAPGYLKLLPNSHSLTDRLNFFIKKVDLHLGNLSLLGGKEKVDYIKANIKRMAYWFYSGMGLPMPRARQEILNAMRHASINYHPQMYQGRLALFRGTKQLGRYDHDPYLGWGKLAAEGVELYRIPGYDGSVILEPHVRILVEQLRACLRTTQLCELNHWAAES